MDEGDLEGKNEKRLFATLPSLIKGYLRLNGYIGQGAIEDHEYNTTDVCIVLRTDGITAAQRDKFIAL